MLGWGIVVYFDVRETERSRFVMVGGRRGDGSVSIFGFKSKVRVFLFWVFRWVFLLFL